MIEVMQGALGSGKSAVATARAIHHLVDGGVVAANFSLVDGWADSVAKQNIFCRFDTKLKHKRASSLHKRFYRVDSLAAINSIKPKQLAVRNWTDDGTYREGFGLLILDECQLVFNARKWEKNFSWIEFFTQSRKLGWNVLLIAHTIEMIDSQIRPLAEYESRFRNLNKVRVPLIGVPMSPIPAFMVVTRYAGLGPGSSTIANRQLYPLPLWAARLYDSLHVFNADDWGKDTQARLCGPPPAPPLCGGVGENNYNAVRVSTLNGIHWDNYLQSIPS